MASLHGEDGPREFQQRPSIPVRPVPRCRSRYCSDGCEKKKNAHRSNLVLSPVVTGLHDKGLRRTGGIRQGCHGALRVSKDV